MVAQVLRSCIDIDTQAQRGALFGWMLVFQHFEQAVSFRLTPPLNLR